MSGFSGIDPQALQAMRAQRDCLLIDVRTDEEVGRGMIAGARHIPLHLLPSRIDTIERDRSVVFYCQSGARSMQASAFLAARGWPEVYNLNGGIVAWVRSGLPVAPAQ
jgi:rhodanese-related sulfurtransferase